jgi:ATP-dependent protease ClpP protease subunit
MDVEEFHDGHHIPLTGTVNHDMLGKFETAIREYLEQPEAERKPVVLTVSSSGGNTRVALSLHEQLRLFAKVADVSVVVAGVCMSAAVTVLLALPKSKRFSTKHSLFLVHQLQHGPLKIPPGPHRIRQIQFEETAFDQDVTQYEYDWAVGLIARATGQKKKRIKELCDPGTIYSAQEALELGLVSAILA